MLGQRSLDSDYDRNEPFHRFIDGRPRYLDFPSDYQGIVPVFWAPALAFMSALIANIGGKTANIPKAQGGIIVAGLIYVVFAILVYFLGIERIKNCFRPS